MRTVTSADGTVIAFDRFGQGPPVIMAVGAFNDRSTTAPLAKALEPQFTILNYDRRGRGDSGDTAPYSVDREIEDIDALIAEAGGSSAVFGYSSGANLALKAAARGLAITKLVLYEPPFLVDESRPRPPADLPDQLADLISAGRRGDTVELYQTKAVGIPEEVVMQMRHAPFRPALEDIAHTLIYDATIIGDLSLPTELIGSIVTPTLVIDGEQSLPFDARRGASRRGRTSQRVALLTRRSDAPHLAGRDSAHAGGLPRQPNRQPGVALHLTGAPASRRFGAPAEQSVEVVMSAENVEIVRAAYEAFGRGDLETVAGHFAQDVEWETPDSVPLGGLVSGRDAVIGNFAELPSLWSSFSVEPLEYIDAGDHVVVTGVQRATGPGGSFESRYLHLFKLSGGKVVRGEFISDTAKARDALGS